MRGMLKQKGLHRRRMKTDEKCFWNVTPNILIYEATMNRRSQICCIILEVPTYILLLARFIRVMLFVYKTFGLSRPKKKIFKEAFYN